MRGQNSFIVFVNTSHHPRRTQDVFKVKRQTVLLYLTFCFIFSWFFVLRFVFPFYLKFSHWKWNYNIIHSSINLVQLGANRQFINFECKWSSCQFRNFGKASPFSRSFEQKWIFPSFCYSKVMFSVFLWGPMHRYPDSVAERRILVGA